MHSADAQSVVRLHGCPLAPVVQRPALLPPVEQWALAQWLGATQNEPMAPSVHSPRPRPFEYAQVPSMHVASRRMLLEPQHVAVTGKVL